MHSPSVGALTLIHGITAFLFVVADILQIHFSSSTRNPMTEDSRWVMRAQLVEMHVFNFRERDWNGD